MMHSNVAWLFAVLFCASVALIHTGTAMLLDRRSRAMVAGGLVGVAGGVVALAILTWGML